MDLYTIWSKMSMGSYMDQSTFETSMTPPGSQKMLGTPWLRRLDGTRLSDSEHSEQRAAIAPRPEADNDLTAWLRIRPDFRFLWGGGLEQ